MGDARVAVVVDLVGYDEAGEAPRDREADAVLGERAVGGQVVGFKLFFEGGEGGGELAFDAFDPRLVLDVGRAQVAFVVELHGFFAGGEAEADQAQGLGALAQVFRQQGFAGGGFEVVEDERGVHQYDAVVEDQCRRFDHRVDPLELFEVAEHRDRLVFEGDAQALGGDRHAPHVRGVEHADQFHDAFLQVEPVGRHNLAELEAIVSRRSLPVGEFVDPDPLALRAPVAGDAFGADLYWTWAILQICSFI